MHIEGNWNALWEDQEMSRHKIGTAAGDAGALLVGLLLATPFFLILAAPFVGGW